MGKQEDEDTWMQEAGLEGLGGLLSFPFPILLFHEIPPGPYRGSTIKKYRFQTSGENILIDNGDNKSYWW